jgi:hypothetical protein
MKNALVVLVCVLALRLPFLNHAIQGDDVYYLAGAQHAQVDPLHPHHARYPFQGVVVDMRGHPHPPLNTWVLAGLLAVAGDVREPVFHAAYIVFSLIAAFSTLSLARRFSPHPLLATLMFLAAPAFVVNGTSLEADLPLLAFWMAAVALFVRGSLLLSIVAMALAAMTAYQAVFLVPVLAAWLYFKKSRRAVEWATVLVPLAVVGGWQLYERSASGTAPATVLTGYFQEYALQRLAAKLRNAAALTVHTGWLVFPVVAVMAFARKRVALVLTIIGLALAFLDPHPLFWASWMTGAIVLTGIRGDRFLVSWVWLFFASALVVFFAGSARYLLPIAAPVAILATRVLEGRTRLLAAGCAASFALGLCLAVANRQHWDGYRAFAGTTGEGRTWINAEWGFRFYAESAGALPLLRTTRLLPGDTVLNSELGGFEAAAKGPRTPLRQAEIRPWMPFRLIGLGARSGYSTAAAGLRAFDITTQPVDRVSAEVVSERRPTLTWAPMTAEDHIVEGLFNLEDNAWRWTGKRAAVAVRAAAAPAEASFYIPDAAPARLVRLLVNGRTVAEQRYPGPGTYTLRSVPVTPDGDTATVSIEVDKTFRAPGDQRDLGLVLRGMGFRP